MRRSYGIASTVLGLAALSLLFVALSYWSDEPVGKDKPTRTLSVRVGMDAKELPPPNWIARSADIGVRWDERRQGLLLKHQVLQLKSVDYPPARLRPGGSTMIFTDSSELQERVNDVLEGRIPVNPGADGTFAVGRLVGATLVRLDATGHVRAVEDVRVSFVALTHTRAAND